jgi:hypothetical protein
MAKITQEEWQFQFNTKYFKEILDCIIDLSKLNPMVKIKLDSETALFYSRAGTDNTIPAFKSFSYPINNFIIAEEYKNIDFIILNGSNFVKNSLLLINKDNEIHGKFIYNEKQRVASQLYTTNGNLKLNFVSGDYTQIKDITKEQIETRMDPANSNFSFIVTGSQFKEIKKLVTLNKSETIGLKAKNNKLEFYDKRWSINLGKTEADDEIWTFNNKYLKSISPDEETGDIIINMFDQFLLIKEGNTHLMIGLELSDLK